MTPPKEMEVNEENTADADNPAFQAVHIGNGNAKGDDVDANLALAKEIAIKLASVPIGNGDASVITQSDEEVKINIETDITDSITSPPPPIIALTKISSNVASSAETETETDADGDGHCTLQFSEEKEAPEVSTRVYDFDMVKKKTLPRRMLLDLDESDAFMCCSNQPRNYVMAWTCMGVTVPLCVLVLLLFWLWD